MPRATGAIHFKIDLARRGIARALSASRARYAAVAVVQEDHLSTAMAPYIGTATSRIDGVAKVTGAAKYAAEFNAPGLLYGSVVTSTIAKGRITRIDTSAAKRVKGVLDVLTHANRPPMADDDKAYKDEVAPSGSPFRPLYDDRIMFNGQPIALVVAETSEVARFAASLVRVEYEKKRTRHRCVSSARGGYPRQTPDKRRSRRCSRHRRRAVRRSRHLPPRQCATKPNITRRSSITTQWSSMQRR